MATADNPHLVHRVDWKASKVILVKGIMNIPRAWLRFDTMAMWVARFPDALGLGCDSPLARAAQLLPSKSVEPNCSPWRRESSFAWPASGQRSRNRRQTELFGSCAQLSPVLLSCWSPERRGPSTKRELFNPVGTAQHCADHLGRSVKTGCGTSRRAFNGARN